MATVLQSFLGQAGIKIETTPGTYRAPTLAQDFLFYTSIKLEDLIEDNVDESFRGQAAKDQGFYPGFRSARVTITSPLAQFPTGYFFKGWLGTDVVTGGADPFTHTFSELDTAAPPTFTITVYDATIANTRAVTNCILQRLRITMANKGLAVMEAVLLGKFDSTANAKPTAVYDTSPHYTPWLMNPTIGGSGSTKLIQFEMIMEREVEPVFGFSGTQDLTTVSGGRIQCTGSAIWAPSDNTEADYYRLGTVVTFSGLMTNTASHTLLLQMSSMRLVNGTFVDQSGPFVRVNAKYRAIRNATDAGPAQIVLANAVPVAGYT
jgi:hypothetical protein